MHRRGQRPLLLSTSSLWGPPADEEDVPSADSAERAESGASGAPESVGYLLVIEGQSSSLYPLPAAGEVTVGRAPDAHLRLMSGLVSRYHARLYIADGEVRIMDLQSHNGTRVNGELVHDARALTSGDVIALSDVLLAFHRQVPRVLARPIYPDLTVLRQRLDEEVDRCLRAGRRLRGGQRARERRARVPEPGGFRGLSLLSIHLPGIGEGDRPRISRALGQKVRLMDVLAFDGRNQLMLLLPDVDELEAAQLADRLQRVVQVEVPGARAGFACCPADGCDSDVLLAGARAAMDTAQPGQVLPAADAAQTAQVGGETLSFADPMMIRVHELCVRLSRSDRPVLILGEAGSGRETAALTIHDRGKRRSGPFLRCDCEEAALDEGGGSGRRRRSRTSLSSTSLELAEALGLSAESALSPRAGAGAGVEALLFGVERGALQGSSSGRAGLLEAADGGTLSLTEVAALPLEAQGRLVKLLQGGIFRRVGGTRDVPADVRVICASAQDLRAEVREGHFRAELLELLRGALSGPPTAGVVVLPPLRDRRRDLPVLIKRFLREACTEARREPPLISPAAMEKLLFYPWPGNLPELREAMEYLASAEDPVCEQRHLPPALQDYEA